MKPLDLKMPVPLGKGERKPLQPLLNRNVGNVLQQMPKFDLHLQSETSETGDEDANHLLTVLAKLKETKQNIESSRKR